ncbi:Transport protein particle subunit trs120 [Paramyrothecium foliicola]|nr:Transport protein particle subunit trs120 [Paramyrothecium foliicola]
MSLDPLLPIAPARVKALLLPLGPIKADRFTSFVDRLHHEHVVHLRDITADGRPHRSKELPSRTQFDAEVMALTPDIDTFSPLAFPDGAIIYDLVTHFPPPSHLALAPFDLYREPLAVVALADGRELYDPAFSKRHSANGLARTAVENNIRALYQELEDLRDLYPKALVHRVLIFDYVPPADAEIPIPEGLAAVPPAEDCKRTTMKTVMCDMSSLLLAEMTTLARSFEAMSSVDSPGHYLVAKAASTDEEEAAKRMLRRNSQFALPNNGRSSSASGILDKNQARMSMPPVPSRPAVGSSNSTPGRPSTPVKSGLSNPPIGADDFRNGIGSEPSTPERKSSVPDAMDASRDESRDRVPVQGFGPGGANDRWRIKGKSRVAVIMGSMYLQAGRWTDSLRELSEAAAAARPMNDHIWHGKALELIVLNLFLLGWSRLEFQIPAVCFPVEERPNTAQSKTEPELVDSSQPRCLAALQKILPGLLDRILGLYSRVSSENLPPLPLSETTIRFSKILAAMHICNGKLNFEALDMIVTGSLPSKQLTTSPRHIITPPRQLIVNTLFKAFPSTRTELLTNLDRVSILSGIASVLGPLGYHRKKAMVMRELISVLIGGLVEARTRGAADAGIHPAAGLLSVLPGADQSNGAVALDLTEADIEQGIEAFLGLLCKSYGVVGFDISRKESSPDAEENNDSDEAVLARINAQSVTRFFGFPDIKLNILRACINFSEALPDFHGVFKYSGDLLRTAGSGIVPGPRREDASPRISKDEQNRLATNITRTAALVQRLALSHLTAEYWDEFMVRGLKFEPLPRSRTPIPHAPSALPGASIDRSSQGVNPFIYNPFLKKPDEATAESSMIAGELANFHITLQNTYEVEVEIESIRLFTEGVEFEAIPESIILGPYRTQLLRLKGRPKTAGTLKVTGALVKVQGCRERRFPVFPKPWSPSRSEKVKEPGMASLEEALTVGSLGKSQPEIDSLSLKVIEAQPLLIVKSTTLPQSSVMILEGEKQVFSVTLHNLSSTPVDLMLFSFKDSTQEPLQVALSNRDATPAELHEYEYVLTKRPALRLLKKNEKQDIAAGGDGTFEFEILGKPGLTSATIQVDYTHLGVPRNQVTEQFYTRQVSVDLTVTVNAGVELMRLDTLPILGQIPQPILDRMVLAAKPGQPEEYCLLSMDLRNAWPSQMSIRLESEGGMAVEENVLPGNTSRIILPIKRIYLEDPHASIPSLLPSQKRQFVVSTSKISPDMERRNREAFWYREKLLEQVKATWRTTSPPKRVGDVELRTLRVTSRMVEALKIDEVGIEIHVGDGADTDGQSNVAFVDEFAQLTVRVTNRTRHPIVPLVRLMPALCHRPSNVALDFTRKLSWNGTLQQLLPTLAGGNSEDFSIGVTALCRGEFELTATVEEVRVWEEAKSDQETQGGRPRSDTQTMMEAALGVKERRMWHSRQPFVLSVKDRE